MPCAMKPVNFNGLCRVRTVCCCVDQSACAEEHTLASTCRGQSSKQFMLCDDCLHGQQKRGIQTSTESKMDEQLVLCVSEFLDLYNTSLRSYRNVGRKAVSSWRHISIQVDVEFVLSRVDCCRQAICVSLLREMAILFLIYCITAYRSPATSFENSAKRKREKVEV